MKKILSVVIPTYNMEKYLENCLKSFIYDENAEDVEVLIVNDGSKDNSINIAKEYEEKYPKIFKVVDKENGGHGSTINAGLKVAEGKFFKVVDSDDWVETKEFEKLLRYLDTSEDDCICSNYTYVYEDINKIELANMCEGKDDSQLRLKDLNDFKFAMHSFVFKTDKIKEVRLQEHCFYVDVEYNLYCVTNCETVRYLPLNIYQYRLGRPGQSVSPQGFMKHRDNHLTVVKNICKFLENNKDRVTEFSKKYINEVIGNHYYFYKLIYKLDKTTLNELVEFDKWLSHEYPELYNATNENDFILKLRNKKFKNMKLIVFIEKFKSFVKKIIGRK